MSGQQFEFEGKKAVDAPPVFQSCGMVPKKDESDDENSCSSAFTSESSDSYSYLLRDVDNPVNQINEEWEAIERTLYEEDGKHVTDPALVKECKLWRETFPHLRVRGTAANAVVTTEENVTNKASKSIEAIAKNQLELCKISEKREKIKETVVSHIVERLITKLNLNKENSCGSAESAADGAHEMSAGKKAGFEDKSPGYDSEKECYFERGKGSRKGPVPPRLDGHPRMRSDAEPPSDVSEAGDCRVSGESREGPAWSARPEEKRVRKSREHTSNLARNEEILRSGNLAFKITRKLSGSRVRSEKGSDCLSSLVKPFEASKKLDRKYENMLERILESKGIVPRLGDSRRSSETKVANSCGESMEKLLAFQANGQSVRRNKHLPRISNSANLWMNRADYNVCDPCADPYRIRRESSFARNLPGLDRCDLLKGPKSCDDRPKNRGEGIANGSYRLDESLLEELKREVWNNKASSTWKNNWEEDVSLRRPQLHNRCINLNHASRTQKSSSCGDLPKKNMKPRGAMSGAENGKSDVAVKNGAKGKTLKNNENKNLQLPPIEASIICTELTARPKIPARTFPKKYI